MVRVSDRDSFSDGAAHRARRGAVGRRIVGHRGGCRGEARQDASEAKRSSSCILPDSGRGYMSKIFNDDWMIANGFLADAKRRATVGDVLRSKTPLPPMITVQTRRHRARPRSTFCASTKFRSCRSCTDKEHRRQRQRRRRDASGLRSMPISCTSRSSEVMGRPFPVARAARRNRAGVQAVHASQSRDR